MNHMKKLTAFLLIFALLGTHVLAFTDTKDHPLAAYTDAAAEAGIVTGYPDGTFLPDRIVDRAGFTAMVNRALGLSGCADVAFSDVPGTQWYAPEVEKALSVGYINGKSADKFAPTDSVTRGEAAVMLARLAGWESTDSCGYSDFLDTLPDWLKPGMSYAYTSGIYSMFVPADAAFEPYEPMTRAQCAAVITTFSQALEKTPVYLTCCKESDTALFVNEDSILTLHISARELFRPLGDVQSMLSQSHDPQTAADAYEKLKQQITLDITTEGLTVTGTYLTAIDPHSAEITLTLSADADTPSALSVTATPADRETFCMAEGFDSVNKSYMGKETALYAALDAQLTRKETGIILRWTAEDTLQSWAILLTGNEGDTWVTYSGDIVRTEEGLFADLTKELANIKQDKGTILIYGAASEQSTVRPYMLFFDLTAEANTEVSNG